MSWKYIAECNFCKKASPNASRVPNEWITLTNAITGGSWHVCGTCAKGIVVIHAQNHYAVTLR